MKGFGIEIGSVRPLDCSKCGVELDRIEQCQVLKWSEHFSLQDRPKIDLLFTSVVTTERQGIGAHDVEVRDAINGVTHDVDPTVMDQS